MTGSVVLVGAGCGKKKWTTVEGIEQLQSCTAVVYDDLIDPTLLEIVPETAVRVPVGKRFGKVSARQEDINQTLVDLALQGHRVVRLKGGDPFIFGRGGEEIIALNEHDIPWSVVPGITSAIAVPGEAGIPVTHRAVARSLHIITGHTKEESMPDNIENLAKLNGTLVFLMGLNALGSITESLIRFGRDAQTPAAVVSGGNSPRPMCVTGTLENITEQAKQSGIESPAVIVVGDVVGLGLRDEKVRDLRVGLTGTDDFRAKVSMELARYGIRGIDMMRGSIDRIDADIPWNEIDNQWVTFTSVQGVHAFFDLVRKSGRDLRLFARAKFAVIGSETRKALADIGFNADLCPETYTSEALAEILKDTAGKIFLFCSAKGSRTLENVLGDRVRRIDVYDTRYTVDIPTIMPEIIVFGSAGGVRALFEGGFVPTLNQKFICIGPVCADALKQISGIDAIRSDTITAEGIANAVFSLIKA